MKRKLGAILLVVALALALAVPMAIPVGAHPGPGLAAQWHFDGNATDSSGYGNDGTVYGGASYVTGKYGQALSFDGSDDYVDFGSGVTSLIAGDYTVEAWIKPTSLASGRHAAVSFSYMELGHNAGKVYFWQAYDNSWGKGYKYTSPSVLLDVTKFTHIVGVFHLDAGVDLYVDGNYIGSGTTKTGTSVNIFGNTYAGDWYWIPPGGGQFDGIIDEVRIWDEARTADQIKLSYEALHVDDDGVEWPGGYTTIQAAVDVANPGDTIMVHDGTYTEDLTIPAGKTNLELKSASGATDTTIKGVQVLPWPTHAPCISVLASGVKIHGFTIESPDYSSTTGNPHSSGIAVGAANVEIYENTFVSTDDGTGNSAGWCTSIETYGAWAGDVSGLNIHDNTFTSETGIDKGSEGVYINYNGNNPNPVGTVTIANNTFGGQIFRAITTERSKTTISGNTITSSYAPNPAFNAALYGIDVFSPGANPNPNQDTVLVTSNSVNGFWRGIKLGPSGNDLTNISVTCNTVQLNTVGIKVYSSADGVVVNCNNISGNTSYGVENTDSANTLDATNNWWGHASGPYHSTNLLGLGDAVSDYVDYSQWAYIPDFCEAKTMGYWKTHPDLVEGILDVVTTVELAGEVVDLETAQEIFASAKSRNYYMLAAQLLAAKLNVLQLEHFNPGYDSSCVDDAIVEADAFLEEHLVGEGAFSDRLAKSDRATVNELKDILDAFNNDGCPDNVCPCTCD